MRKEIEQKILDVEVPRVVAALERVGARFSFDRVQRIFTYDLLPYGALLPGLIEFLLGTEERTPARELVAANLRLAGGDLDDLLGADDKRDILGSSSYRSLGQLFSEPRTESPDWRDLAGRASRFAAGLGVNPNKWVRLREEGGVCTLAVKQILRRRTTALAREHSPEDSLELEVEVSDADTTRKLLEHLGYFPKNYQEKRRKRYLLSRRGGEVVVDIDKWPLIPAYLEIEAASSEEIREVAAELGFAPSDLRSMNADDVFQLHGLDMYSYRELRLELDEQNRTDESNTKDG